MEQRNILLAFLLSTLVLIGWQLFFTGAPQKKAAPPDRAAGSAAEEHGDAAAMVAKGEARRPPSSRSNEAAADRSDSTPEEQGGVRDPVAIARIHNDVLEIAVNRRGTLIDARLKRYRESVDPDAPLVHVLYTSEKKAQYVGSGIVGRSAPVTFRVAERHPDRVVLTARLEKGRIWRRTLRLAPGSYRLEVEDRITGGAGSRIYLQAVERYPNKKLNTFYEHAGPIGLVEGKLQEPDYDELDEKGAILLGGIGGWTGIMSRYFLTAIYGDQRGDYHYYYKGDGRAYQAGIILESDKAGRDARFHTSIFIGPKSLALLKSFGVGLERSVDYGLFAFIAKPMHQFMLWLYGFVHNFGVCIIILVVLIKIIFYLPSQKSYASMAAMRKLQPELKRLQERYADDRQKLGEEMMKLYKKHKVNPLGGCLPILIQIPVFFALYKVLLMSIEMRQAPFVGWIQDLSVHDPWFILPVLMGISMLVQTKLNPQPPDPMQAKVMQFLPVIFTVMFLFFPAGLVLYWLVNNVLSIIQQRLVMRQVGL
ncbi:MAG: membrane protein insertase YidC [Zetaproteobacteria bacterium]|nr:MAG: membrane protein insertase YidC [Zetaproteobacteria bacterium]